MYNNKLLAISYLPTYYMKPDVLVKHIKCFYFYDEQLL